MLPEGVDGAAIVKALTYFLAMLLSLTIHEAAHAFAAKLRGDDTAERLGRLTLNPLAHIDWLGTVLLPLAGALTSLPVVGWAKPVPVDLSKLKNRRWDNLLVSLAGPGSNLLLCFVALVTLEHSGVTGVGQAFVLAVMWVNFFLAIFNMLPIPPLDGAAIIATVLPADLAYRFERRVAPYGMFVLIVLLASGGLKWLPAVALNIINFLRQIVKTAA